MLKKHVEMSRSCWLKVGKLFALAWSLLIVILCLMPADDLPKEEWFPNLDKVVHFVFYLVLSMVVLFISTSPKSVPSPKTRLILLFGGSCLIEVLQLLLPINRSFSFLDLMANLIGLVIGWFLFAKTIRPLVQ